MNDEKPAAKRKVTPLFVPDPGPPSARYVPGELDMFGRPPAGEPVAAESPEAASHWQPSNWRRVLD